jgi:hypothetical protein
MKDEALRLALEALKKSDGFLYNWHENSSDDEADAYATARQLNEKAITAIKAALEAKNEPEQMAKLGWQVIDCPICGGGARAFPKQEAKDEPYAFEASMYSNDRIKIDPVTGNVSIGTVKKPCGLECDCTDVCKQEAKDEPVKLRRGDILRCNESDELCTVWATSTSGKTLVKWRDNDFGSYTAEQIGELFWIEPKEEDEPDYKALWQQMCERCDELDKKLAHQEAKDEPVGLIESLKDAQPCCGQYETCWRACTPRGEFLGQRDAQRTWVGLTNQELADCWDTIPERAMRRVEAKLKEKHESTN